METLGVTPAQMGLRVRAHPGNLAITAANKMAHADFVQISFSGQRHQTIWFHETDERSRDRTLFAARQLGARCSALGKPEARRDEQALSEMSLQNTWQSFLGLTSFIQPN